MRLVKHIQRMKGGREDTYRGILVLQVLTICCSSRRSGYFGHATLSSCLLRFLRGPPSSFAAEPVGRTVWMALESVDMTLCTCATQYKSTHIHSCYTLELQGQ